MTIQRSFSINLNGTSVEIEAAISFVSYEINDHIEERFREMVSNLARVH